MVQAVNGAGVPAALSYTAGAFVCNDLLYTLLHRFDTAPVKIGFIHVPCTLGMRESGGMPLEDVVKALEAAVSALE
jgi:pyroglutamyl-peptidase